MQLVAYLEGMHVLPETPVFFMLCTSGVGPDPLANRPQMGVTYDKSSNPIASAIFIRQSPDYSGLCRFWGLVPEALPVMCSITIMEVFQN